MKFTANNTSFRNYLAIASSVTGKSIMPVLNNVDLKVSADGLLTITATNLSQTVYCTMQVSNAQEGHTTVNGKKLISILSNLSGEELEFSLDESNRFRIICNSGKYALCTIAPEDFDTEAHETVASFKIPAEELNRLLKDTANSALKDNTRPMLAGVYLDADFNEKTVCAVGTDGKRMANSFSGDVEIGVMPEGGKASAIIPLVAIPLFSKLEGEVVVKFENGSVAAFCDGITIRTKLQTGTYPNYKQVIPASFSNAVKLNTKELTNKVSLLSCVSENSVIDFTIGNGSIDMSVNSPDGEGKDGIKCDAKAESPIVIRINGEYLIDAVTGGEDEITMSFNDGISPLVVDKSAKCRTVIMPIRSK